MQVAFMKPWLTLAGNTQIHLPFYCASITRTPCQVFNNHFTTGSALFSGIPPLGAITTSFGQSSLTLLNNLTGSYPVERAQSLVETLLMSPSFSEAVARAAVSSGFPVCGTQKFKHTLTTTDGLSTVKLVRTVI